MWGKAKTSSKAGFDRLYGLVDKLGPPVNKLSNKLGAEAFWPTSLDKESEKAARILRSFCKDGFYEEELQNRPDGISEKQKVLKKIPAEVIRNARGLAIFTTMRTGLWASGSGGSGVLVGRLPDGSWSPPSGLMLHTVGLGFLVGVDIYDCVMVINTDEALKAFSKLRCTVGGEISAVAGPVGIGGVLDSEVHRRRAPIFTYLKSRGFYVGLQIDGTILIERTDANEEFYKEKISVGEIMAGKVRHPPYEIRPLMATIKAAMGDQVDASELPEATGLAPSDFDLEAPKEALPGGNEIVDLFGVPDKDDPDPYGVLALEKEGLAVREAGTHAVAPPESFIFNPSPSSPVFNAFNRSSFDSRTRDSSRRNSHRLSAVSTGTQTVDMAAPTEYRKSASLRYSVSSGGHERIDELVAEHEEASATISERLEGLSMNSGKESPAIATHNPTETVLNTDESSHPQPEDREAPTANLGSLRQQLNAESDYEEEDEDPVVYETVQTAVAPRQTFAAVRGKLVQVEKKSAPVLPPRNPVRDRKRPLIIGGTDTPSESEHSHDRGTSPASSHRGSIGSNGATTDTSKATSISSPELGKETSDERRVRNLSSEQGAESEFHSAPSTPGARSHSPVTNDSLNSVSVPSASGVHVGNGVHCL